MRTCEALDDAVSQNGLLQSIFVETDRLPGEVLGNAVARSDGNLYEVELLEKDSKDENNGGIHPWSVEADKDATTTVTIQGVTASSTAGNITLTAYYPAGDGGLDELAQQTFSVVNVTLSLLTSGTVPSAYPDSSALPILSLAPAVWPPETGNYTTSDQSFCTTPYFVSGLVTPANYPGLVTLRRTIVLEDLCADPSNTPVAPTPISSKDDTGVSSYNWNSPSESSGYVYDWDAPGISETDVLDPSGEVNRARINFSEYAVLGNSSSTVTVGNPMPLFARVSCAKLTTGAKLDTTYPGDNTVGSGTTKTTRTLQ